MTTTTKKKPVPQEVQAPPEEESKEPQQEEQPHEPVYLSPLEAEQARQRRVMTAAAIVSNGAVRQVSKIIQNGTRMSGHEHVQFTAHDGLVAKMLTAFDSRRTDREEAEKRFLEALEQYLEQAVLHIPQSGRKEDIPILIGLLTLLIHEHEADNGFEQVAGYILTSGRSPIDRF